MQSTKRTLIALLLSAAATLAHAFPDKPVRMVVPYPAGGPVDLATRIVAEGLAKKWGQSVIVENKPGASGAIGTEAVIKSPADGYTMLLHSPIMVATELTRPDYVALAESFGVPGVRTTPETLEADLSKALSEPGPSVVVLPALLRMFAPTHLTG